MNILIVDDEAYLLEEIKYYVKKYGFFNTCIAYDNAADAINTVNSQPIDIALLDIQMPRVNGLELAERLTDMIPDIEIIFITAYNNYATEAFEANAIDYILKPIREERLYKTLDKIRKKSDNANQMKGEKSISINMLGKYVVRVDGKPHQWNRHKAAELFAYLLQNKGYPIDKEKLCGLLWHDVEIRKALVNLQSTVYSIRKTFESSGDGAVSILYTRNKYLLQVKNAYIDVDQFESTVQQAVDMDDMALLNQAVALYKGDYLEEEGWLWAET
jgi:two-component SAPR family response regulator